MRNSLRSRGSRWVCWGSARAPAVAAGGPDRTSTCRTPKLIVVNVLACRALLPSNSGRPGAGFACSPPTFFGRHGSSLAFPPFFGFPQRAWAALRAISERCSGVSFCIRAKPLFLPPALPMRRRYSRICVFALKLSSGFVAFALLQLCVHLHTKPASGIRQEKT